MPKPHSYKIKKWFSDHNESMDDNGQLLDNLVQQWKDEDLLDFIEDYESIDSVAAWESINNSSIRSANKAGVKALSIRRIMRYAAIFILPLATSFYLLNIFFNAQKVQTLDQTIALTINNERSVLIGQNESTIYDENNSAIAQAGVSSLTYFPQNFKNGLRPKSHSLKVPLGKTFQVTLSDGTKIYCDAGTTLIYPTHFEGDTIRKVQLEGQAFFDVTKNKRNPFVVHTENMDVRVLGTQFNINAYSESKVVKTVLVEGSIIAYTKDAKDSVLLVPNQQVIATSVSEKLQVTQVNAYDHFAWVTGKLVFNKVTFNEILRTLERKFGVEITNNNTNLGKQVFTAKFENETIDKVMRAFKSEAGFDYEVKNNNIIIK